MIKMAMDNTMKNVLLILGALVTFVFTILTFAFGADIALYSMAVKNDIFWESKYGYSNWNDSSDSLNEVNGTPETGVLTVYHTNAETIETDTMDAIMDAADIIVLAGSIITLVLLAAAFFRKDGGLINMFRNVQN